MDRRSELRKVFDLYDRNGNGMIEIRELLELTKSETLQAKLEEARETMAWLDRDGDHQVSPQEFCEVFEFISAGMDDREFELYAEDMKVQAGGTTTREMMLKRVFQQLDRDKSGYIELYELKSLVGRVAPAESVSRAHGTLRMFDANEDGRVSVDEYLTFFNFLAQDMDDTEFHDLLRRLSEKGFEALYEGDYKHPHDCRGWLQAEVVPLLREGLVALAGEVERHKLDLATGVPWDEGVHMPRGWRPFSPCRWLADWLTAAANRPPPGTDPRDGGGVLGAEGEGGEGPGRGPGKSLEEMDREEKLAYIFAQIDANAAGSIPAPHVVATAELIFADGAGGVTDPSALIGPTLAGLGLHPQDSSVDVNEFTQALMQMTSMLSEEEFDEAARVVAAQRDWRYCRSRPDKFRYLFHSLDLDHSGQLSLPELKVLAQRMDPDTSEETIAATLEFLDKDNSESVSTEEFVEAMCSLLSHVDTEEELDDMVQRMLHIGSGVDAATEVEPGPLADFARGLRTHHVAAQLPASAVMDKLSSRQPLVLLDVRPEEERAVSTMPGALPLNLQPAPAATWGYSLAGGGAAAASLVRDGLAIAAAAAAPSAQPPVVVSYCSTGELGGVAALLLSDALKMTVYNMCGGIINYYNQGGSVCRATDGKQVQALHPGSVQQRAFVTRPNNFKL